MHGKSRREYEAIANRLDGYQAALQTERARDLVGDAAQAIRDLCLMVWGEAGRLFEDVETGENL